MSTRKKGGRFIGQGTYGCVFGSPPLQCKGKTRSTSKVISKLLDTYSANDEYTDGLVWKKIDPEQNFSIWASQICRFDAKDVVPSDQPELCTSESVKSVINGTYSGRLIFYNYGGIDLSKLKPKSINYISIIYAFYKLLGGFVIAHENNIAHMDVKEPNIVCDLSSNSIVLRLIDFGLCIDTSTILSYSDTRLNIYTSPYLYWPFELQCLKPVSLEKKYADFCESVKYHPKYFPARSYANESGDPYPYDEFKGYVADARKFDFKRLLTGVDVYSLGLILTRIVHIMFHHRMDRKNNVIVDGVPDPSTWHINVIAHITRPLLHLALKMVERNPTNRITVREAKTEFKKIIPHLTTYLLQKDVHVGLRGMNILGLEPKYKNIPTPVLPLTPSLGKAELDKLFEEHSLNKETLKRIYASTSRFPNEESELVKIARTLGSRKSFIGKTKISVVNDIIKKGEKKGLNLKF